MTEDDYRKILEGCEVESTFFEGVVGIKNGKIIQMGKVINDNPSLDIWKRLFYEYCDQEASWL